MKVGQVWITENGQRARILATDVENYEYPVVAAVSQEDGGESVEEYTGKGKYFYDSAPSEWDLVKLAPKKVKIELWICIVKGTLHTTAFNTEADARKFMSETSYTAVDLVPFTHEVEIEE